MWVCVDWQMITSVVPVLFVTLSVDGVYRITAGGSSLGVFMAVADTADCGLGVTGAISAGAGSHCEQPR